jgi:hypothetical protein
VAHDQVIRQQDLVNNVIALTPALLILFGHQSVDRRGDLLHVRFERKMPGVQQLDDGIGIVAAIRLRSGPNKKRIMLAPDCPVPRAVELPEAGEVVAVLEVGGLHHHYERRAA